MKIKVTWTEEWQRAAEVDVDSRRLVDEIGHEPPYTTNELSQWLHDTATEDGDGWLCRLPNLDISSPEVDFWGLDIVDTEVES